MYLGPKGYRLAGFLTLALAQSGGVWRWHHYSQAGQASPTVGWSPSSSHSPRILPGKVVAQDNRVYILGTIAHQNGGDGVVLPNTLVSLTGVNGGDTSAYVAAYDVDGNWLWAMHFRSASGSITVRGIDLVVDRNHRVYVLLHARRSGRLGARFYRSGSQADITLSPDETYNYNSSFVIRFRVDGANPTDWAVQRFACASLLPSACDNNAFQANLFHLLLQGDNLWVSGTVVTTQFPGVNNFLTATLTSITAPILQLLFSLGNPLNPLEVIQATLLRLDVTDLRLTGIATMRRTPNSSVPCFGRIPFWDRDPNPIGWFVAKREAGEVEYRKYITSDANISATTYNGLPPSLQIFFIDPHNLTLIDNLEFAQFAPNSNDPPGFYHAAAVFNSANSSTTLFWATVGTAAYTFSTTQGNVSLSQTSEPRLILTRAEIARSGPLQIQIQPPLVSRPVRGLYLSALAYDPLSRGCLVSGTLEGSTWQLEDLSNGSLRTLPAAPAPNGVGTFLLGVRQPPSAPWRLVGYKFLHGVGRVAPRQQVLSGGLAIIGHNNARAYLYGWALDSLLVEPRWPEGDSALVRPAPNPTDPPRLWVGALDLYRLFPLRPSVHHVCVPDTVLTGEDFILYAPLPAEKEAELVWVPAEPERRFRAKNGWAAATAARLTHNQLSNQQYQFIQLSLVVPGRLPPGEYFLALRAPAPMGDYFADIVDTLKIRVLGTTTPALQRAGSLRWRRAVVLLAGAPSDHPAASTAPLGTDFYRKARHFAAIERIAYLPWRAAEEGKELLYLLERTTDPVSGDFYHLYRLDFSTGQIRRLRQWPASSNHPDYRGRNLIADPVRGELWTQGERVLWRLHPTDPTRDEPIVLHTGTDPASFSPTGYPLRHPERWTHVGLLKFIVTENGDLVGLVGVVGTRIRLVRIDPLRDSALFVAGGGTATLCPDDGQGTQATFTVYSLSNPPVSEGDTIYWFERATCGTQTTWWLRRAWPNSPDRKTYTVQTLQSFPNRPDYRVLAFGRVPRRGLYIATSLTSSAPFFYGILWFDLVEQRLDTIIGCLETPCCTYELSDWVNEFAIPSSGAVLRSGVLVYSSTSSFIKAALPVQLESQSDTLVAEAHILQASAGSFQHDTLFLSPADSMWLRVHTCATGPTQGKPFWYGRLRFPNLTLRLVFPSQVCEGMVFSGFGALQGGPLPQEGSCEIGGELIRRIFAQILRQHNRVRPLLGGLILPHYLYWLKAWAAGPEVITVGGSLGAKWGWLVPNAPASAEISIRRGYRLRLRTALQGPWAAHPGSLRWMHPHPFFHRLTLGRYNQASPPSIPPDSLWRLPRYPSDSLIQLWGLLQQPPPQDCSWPNFFCDPIWTNLARVEVYETNGQRVDSAYALIDTLGRLYLYRAPVLDISDFLGNGDTLHFCQCDPHTPKYFVLRTPNHLPLYSRQLTFPARGVGEADVLDLTDPSFLEGLPGQHYALLGDTTGPSLQMRAGAWAGNCADLFQNFLPGPHHDSGVINAADLEFLLLRNGVTTGFSWADLDADGQVTANDAVILLENQNLLRQSYGP